MGLSKLLATLSVAALACLAPTATAQDKPLPWDGRGQDLTVATLETKYKLHILKQRQSGTGNPADYVTIQPKGRSPAFNGDTGVINIAVDDKAIFGGQANFRRSELVQNVASASTMFFRTSVLANAEIKNKHVWQIVFPESHQWEIFLDATASPNKIQFRTEARVQWEADFSLKTWYNFGVAVESSGITFYTSTGNAGLAKAWSGKSSAPSAQEFHFGMLTLSNDGSAPKMVSGQDILSFNGVSVESSVSTSGGSGGGSSGTSGGSNGTSGGSSGNNNNGGSSNNNNGGSSNNNNGGSSNNNNGGSSNNNNGGSSNNNNGGSSNNKKNNNNGGSSGNNNNNNNGGNSNTAPEATPPAPAPAPKPAPAPAPAPAPKAPTSGSKKCTKRLRV